MLLFNAIRLSKTILTVVIVWQSCWWCWQDSVFSECTSLRCQWWMLRIVANYFASLSMTKSRHPFFILLLFYLSIHSFINSFSHSFFLLLFFWLLRKEDFGWRYQVQFILHPHQRLRGLGSTSPLCHWMNE